MRVALSPVAPPLSKNSHDKNIQPMTTKRAGLNVQVQAQHRAAERGQRIAHAAGGKGAAHRARSGAERGQRARARTGGGAHLPYR